jgi:integrase
MRGAIVKREGGYAVVVDLEPVDGKRRQKWISGYRTRKDAERALAEIVAARNVGAYVEPTKQTMVQFAAEWLGAIAPTVRPSTHASYSRNLRVHLIPRLGSVPLRKLDAGQLNGLYAQLLADGKRTVAYGGGSGLSPRTVRYVHTIVHRMLRDAVRWGRVQRNVADSADPPRATASSRPGMRTWSAEQVRAFLDHARDHRLHAAWMLLATTGMRRAECLGLRWSDLDLDAGRAHVSQTVIMVKDEVRVGSPKTARSRRSVALDPATIAVLREHRRRMAAERLQMGAGFTDNGLVFCRPDGGPLHVERFSRTFVREVAKAGLPRITVHGLRHTWATLALRAGVHPKVVQERLGHSAIGVTLDVYSHVTEGLHGGAANLVAGLIAGDAALAPR